MPINSPPSEALFYICDHSSEEASPALQEERNKIPESLGYINLFEQVTQMFGNIPEGRQLELLKLIETFVKNSEREPITPLPASKAEMKDTGIETYREFVARTRSRDGKKCLEKSWGKFLKACTPRLNRDYICQADIRRLDPQLLKRLEGQYTAKEINEFLPSKTLLNQQIVKTMTKEEKSEIFKMNTMIIRCPSIS